MLGLLPYKELVDFLFFSSFFNGFDFADFCKMCYLKNFNFVLTKNLEMDSSFFRFFISIIFKFLIISNLID
jgi:hypothetical protein